MNRNKIITPTILLLSFVSMFTDIASEMLYPIMPIYLKEIGFSVLIIGLLEGIAEAVSGLSKGYFGKMSDSRGKRAIFVQLGYSLSALSKPLLILFNHPVWVFLTRTMDRFGKGIRTGARDAMLSDEARPETKGRVFGFHRGFDTLGAAIGPLLALIYLYFYPNQYRNLFLIAIIPGIISIFLTLKLKDKTSTPKKQIQTTRFFDFIRYWKTSPVLYRKLLIGLLLFAIVNSSDMFLILKAKESGLSDTQTIGLYIFYNLVYAVLSYPIGILADKLGLKRIFLGGLIIFSIVYFIMPFVNDFLLFIPLFFIYGIFAASTEGVSKAWISNIADKKDTATAIGTYTSFQSICTMIASSLTGVIWYLYGAKTAFMTTAIVTIIVVIYLSQISYSSKIKTNGDL